ncbi:dipeptide/tripeptide permease DtpA [Photobacterium kishitanii]|uniref:Dipeptide/tripeptide permease DtpA n=1 Tax=Photobacterium kishitanii TaxID=318456 RepID=A0A0B7JK25_9GAMM|nr:dipeptide/tripeptide permease DtpA [Photobacterium kishitanii]PSU87608.1 dipeptide/tripeptide permease DtpA [Photobacterium kishitanii]PSU93866.1 dipeptide/tripeptide permease DtpA [Photobacterium kishitanii]CEO41578.1 putative oligopeptide transporter [Photobacterium kishitanii]
MSNGNVFKQPKPFYLIFSIEFWERFGFYGMQAILTVYMVKILGMSESATFTLFGAFTALVFGSVAIGGWVGDKILGTKRTIHLGAIILTVGYALLGLSASSHYGDTSLIYIAMGFIAMGNGLFKANPSSLLAKTYGENDPRLDGAFTMYYMAVNLGSFFSILLTPWIAENFGYSFAFGVSAAGLVITITNFIISGKIVKHIGSKPDMRPVNRTHYLGILIGAIILSFISSILLQHLFYAHLILIIVGIIIVFLYFRELFLSHDLERAKMIVAFLLMLQGVIFFVPFLQMPTSVNFFAIHNVSHDLFGFSVAPEQFQALNSLWVMAVSPMLAIIYNKYGDRFAMPFKFAIGMVFSSFSFLVLVLGAHFANSDGIISSNWLVLSYIFQAVGELLVSGLGLAMVAQLIPQRMMGFAMGMWFLTLATAAVFAGWVATLTAAPAGIINPHQTLALYKHIFSFIGYTTAVIAVLTLITAPLLTRIIRGESKETKVVFV